MKCSMVWYILKLQLILMYSLYGSESKLYFGTIDNLNQLLMFGFVNKIQVHWTDDVHVNQRLRLRIYVHTWRIRLTLTVTRENKEPSKKDLHICYTLSASERHLKPGCLDRVIMQVQLQARPTIHPLRKASGEHEYWIVNRWSPSEAGERKPGDKVSAEVWDVLNPNGGMRRGPADTSRILIPPKSHNESRPCTNHPHPD